jgi:hypothetical protein
MEFVCFIIFVAGEPPGHLYCHVPEQGCTVLDINMLRNAKGIQIVINLFAGNITRCIDTRYFKSAVLNTIPNQLNLMTAILLLHSHLLAGLQTDLFLRGFLLKILNQVLVSPVRALMSCPSLTSCDKSFENVKKYSKYDV